MPELDSHPKKRAEPNASLAGLDAPTWILKEKEV